MKQKKGLIILLAVLLVLCIVYFALRSYNQSQKEAEQAKAEAEEIQVVDIENPVEITYSSEDGSSVSLVKEDDTWHLKDDTETALVQDTIENIADTVSDVQAERQIEDPDSLESYGLDSPAYTITVTGEDGTTETIYIGDGADSDYYMTAGDKENVYTVSSSLPNVLEMNTENLKETETEDTESTEDDSSADDATSSDGSTSDDGSTDSESDSAEE
nr:DUF4340 domain-containing protein [uncultured Sellimonas sp.]